MGYFYYRVEMLPLLPENLGFGETGVTMGGDRGDTGLFLG
jgi:hypothetical protein